MRKAINVMRRHEELRKHIALLVVFILMTACLTDVEVRRLQKRRKAIKSAL